VGFIEDDGAVSVQFMVVHGFPEQDHGGQLLRILELREFEEPLGVVAHQLIEAGEIGQDLFLAANITKGDLSEREYKSARAMDLLAAKTRGMDAYMNQHRLDAVLFAGSMGAAIAAKAGYPSVMVPGGFVSGSGDNETPDYPLGVTFAGRAWSEHKLLRLAYAFEQASNIRRPPPGLLAIGGQLPSALWFFTICSWNMRFQVFHAAPPTMRQACVL